MTYARLSLMHYDDFFLSFSLQFSILLEVSAKAVKLKIVTLCNSFNDLPVINVNQCVSRQTILIKI